MQNDLRSVFVIEKSCNVIELASELSKPCEGKELYRWCSWKFWQKKRHMRLFFYYCSAEQNAFFTLDLHMCFDRFLLAFESRDLSQADKRIIRVSSLPSLVISSITSFSVFQQLRPKLSAKWILSILSDLHLTRKTETNVYFFFWMMKLTNIPNCQVPNSCF